MRILNGWLCGVRQVPVKHFSARPAPLDISLVVIHSISLPPQHFGGHYVDALFTGTLDPAVHPYFKNIYSLELFHGPTLAFKDVGGRFMARLLGYFIKKEGQKDLSAFERTAHFYRV